MRSLIVTVAGTATRFNRDTKVETLKCIYYEEKPQECLLARILRDAKEYDEFIIVGGYLYDRLEEFISTHLSQYESKITLVYNPKYKTYGSGYSLILGINACNYNTEEILFVEGDLAFDKATFDLVIQTPENVITVNHDLISAQKSVVLYVNKDGRLKYIYDTSHNCLEIKEPFTAIYNSGQIWKFHSLDALRQVLTNLTEEQIKGTNLEIIQGYFGNLQPEHYEVIAFTQWFNCNTVADYRQAISTLNRQPRS